MALTALVVAALPAKAADWQVIDLPVGQSVDAYFEINLSGHVYVKIVTQNGPGCAEFWWIVWPFGYVKQAGRHCGGVKLELPGLLDAAVASKLRAGGASEATKLIAAANEKVANSVSISW